MIAAKNPYIFSKRSLKNLSECELSLQNLADNVMDMQLFDFGISCGHRTREEQNQAFNDGVSSLKWPQSKHNKSPSQAFDIVLYVNNKVRWNNESSWYMAIGVFRGAAKSLNINIRVGADWDGDFSTSDQSFHDLPHVELIDDLNSNHKE